MKKQQMLIGITHHKSTAAFLPALLKSLKGAKFAVVVVCNDMDAKQTIREKKKYGKYLPHALFLANPRGGFDLGAMALLFDCFPGFGSVFMLQETTVMKDIIVLDEAARLPGSLALSKGFFHFLGKYRRSIVQKVGIPVPQTKKAAVFWEYYWSIVYADAEQDLFTCADALEDTKTFVMKHGKKRMVLENSYVIKYKSNWGQQKDEDYVNIFPEQLDFVRVPMRMAWKAKTK